MAPVPDTPGWVVMKTFFKIFIKKTLQRRNRYYLSDLGLNTIFNKQKKTNYVALLKHIVYNELIIFGYDVITGMIQNEQDLQNKKYAIEVIGYDPFEDYPEESRKFLFNQLSPYLEDDNNVDDTYKLSQILQIIKNNNQIDICDKKMSILDPLKDADSVKVLNEIKNKLVQSNDKIAKENEISVKNRSNKDAGKSTLTYLMRDLRQKDFDKAEADYYDQLRSPGTRWAVDMSITSIKQNGMFDENDKKEVYEMQLDLIDNLNQQLDEAKEKIRLLTKENDRLKLQLEKVGE